MGYLRAFVLFWYRFIIGDDWPAALIVLAGFAGTYALLDAGLNAFWLLPLAVIVSLSVGLYHLWSRSR